ncbi:MAG: hypothetical protein ACR2PY_04030 [Salinispira sp.]
MTSNTAPRTMREMKATREMKESVKLTDLFGVKPEVWLIYLSVFFLILIVLALILLPGILKDGTRLEIWTNAEGAGMFIDDQLRGKLPGVYFIQRGSHTIDVRAAGFQSHTEKIDVGGRLFFSIFFPRSDRVVITLSPDTSLSSREFRKPVVLELSTLGLFAVSAVRQIPPVFDNYAVSAIGRNDEIIAALPHDILPTGIIGNDQQLRDILRGTSRLTSNALIPNSLGLSTMLNLLVSGDNADIMRQLEDILPTDKKPEQLIRLFSAASASASASAAASPSGAAASGETAAKNTSALNSRELKAALRSLGYSGSLREKNGTLIMSEPVNYALFQQFLSEQDIWSEHNAQLLEDRGLTTANHFLHDPFGKPIHGSAGESAGEPTRGTGALALFMFIEWLEQYAENALIRLPYPKELTEIIDTETDIWEYTGQYIQAYPSADRNSPALIVEAHEIPDLQKALLENRGQEHIYQIFQAAGIQVQNGSDEIGMLSPLVVSPVTTFRLVFERE